MERLDLGGDDLVTGEAVALDLPAAGLALRAASGLLDVLSTLVLVWVVGVVASGVAAGTDAAIAAVTGLVAVVAVLVGIPSAVETLTRGRSLGKLATGTRTVRDDGGPIQFRHALVRALVAVAEVYATVGVPALVTSLLNTKGKRMGDYAAGTYVVRERFTVTMAPPAAMPAHLAGWAAAADIARLPDGLAMAVRQFLGRAGSLSASSREVIGAQLARDVLRYVAPPPPPGHPEYFLAAVLAARRGRDAERLRRDAELRRRVIPSDPFDRPPGSPAARRPRDGAD